MKIFGGNKNSKHAGGYAHHSHEEAAAQKPEARDSAPVKDRDDGAGEYDDRFLPTWAKVIIVVVSVLIILVAGAFVWFKTASRPPVQTGELNNNNNNAEENQTPNGGQQDTQTPPDDGNGQNGVENGDGNEVNTNTENNGEGAGENNGEGEKPKTGRNENMYTFLIAGKDKVGSNTDAIMVVRFDTENYTLNVVSIPRDTYMNTTYRNKKANTLYGSGGADGMMDNIANFVGFRPDGYAIVDLNAFMKLVNAIGGVDYYVPQNMDYDDDYQDLHIHFTKGNTHMTGQMAMEYIRFRHGYVDQDIGRIDAQHDFLMTAAKQILKSKDKVPVTTLIDIVLNDVKTGLKLEECTWLAQELLKMDAENIHFYTMPGNYNDYYNGRNYVTVDVDGWIEMLNDCLNPFYETITTANVDIAGRNENGKMYATSGTIH